MAERLSTGLANLMIGPSGSSMADALNDGVIRIFTGSQPANADAVETGSFICEITQDSLGFTPGGATNGLSFAAAAAGLSLKTPGEVWSGVVLTPGGTAGYFRFYSNARQTGASGTAVRFDGNISTSGADMNLGNTLLVTGATLTLDNGQISLPLS